ncbi:MAG: glycosyltransferase family 4 protein [Chthoniobacteraceae bacterium]
MTSARHREGFETARQAGKVPENVTVVYHGEFKPWHPNRFWARVQDWREFVAWTKSLLPAAKALHARVGFDVAHHVTYSTWRVASPLWQLPVPFVWGPVGGAGHMPARFHSTLSRQGRNFERIRGIAGLGRFSPALRRCAQRAAHVFVSCQDTRCVVGGMRGTEQGISILSPGFFSPEQLARFANRRPAEKPRGELQIFAGGNMIGSKGVALALRALAAAKGAGLKFRYTVAGGGPEEAHLRQLASELGLSEVSFVAGLSGDAYLDALRASHVYLLPSFRENIGLTMMEAMLSGAVPVVLDRSAPGEIVTGDSGVRVPSESVDQVVRDMTAALLRLDRDRTELARMGTAAVERIERGFSQEHYRREVDAVYRGLSGG